MIGLIYFHHKWVLFILLRLLSEIYKKKILSSFRKLLSNLRLEFLFYPAFVINLMFLLAHAILKFSFNKVSTSRFTWYVPHSWSYYKTKIPFTYFKQITLLLCIKLLCFEEKYIFYKSLYSYFLIKINLYTYLCT